MTRLRAYFRPIIGAVVLLFVVALAIPALLWLLVTRLTTYGSVLRSVGGNDVTAFTSGVPVGALYLGFSQQSIDAALVKARNQAIVITLVMMAAGVGGAVALATLLSRPIFRLVEGTRSIAAGNFNVTLDVPSRDEIGALTQAFNQMARSLREKEMIKRAFTRYVAREVVKAEEVVDYTPRDNVAERIAKRFGAAMGEGAVKAMRSVTTIR